MMMRTLTTAAIFALAADAGPTLRGSRRLQTSSPVAQGLFVETGEGGPIGASSTKFECGNPGSGTVMVENGPGGCLNAQPGIAGFNTGNMFSGPEVARNQTIQSFLVYKCGMVAIHSHANAVETNTVVHGEGIIAQFTPNSGKLQMSRVREGDSFFFAQGSYHWWVNLGEEDLLTIGTFVNTAGPDAALDGYDENHGIVSSLMDDQTLLHLLIGKSDGVGYNTEPFNGMSPLFPLLNDESCNSARAMMQDSSMFTTATFQVNPSGTKLFMASELESGKYTISSDSCPVNGPGGGLRPLAGVVSKGMPFVTGTDDTMYNGGLAPYATPQPTLWPGLTNVGLGTSLVKFVVGYCGAVAIHTHVNAAEWNTVIEGEGEVAYWGVNNGLVKMQVKKGDTFVFPQGAAHYWVNYSPNTQLVTVGGFTAPFPDTAMLESFLSQTSSVAPFITEAVLGKNYKTAAELEPNSGADTLFPLLPYRSPSNCGGDIPCQRCT